MGSKKRERKSHGDDYHPLSAMKKRRKLHFFKILTGDFHHRLKIPPTFLKHILDESSDQAILRLPNGKTSWSVSLDRTRNGTFLSSGWQTFVKDCALNEYELLVFSYEGSMRFTVILFDKSACQKNVVMPRETDSGCKRHKGMCEQKGSMNEGKCATFLKVRDHVKIGLEDLVGNSVKDDVSTSSAPSRKKREKERNRHNKQHILDAETAASLFHSEFPYFVKRLVDCNVCKYFTLDPTGRLWTVVCIPGNTCMISAGWTAFARGNHLRVGDFCAFEKVGRVKLRVTIFATKRNAKTD